MENKQKISITISTELLDKIKQKSKELDISISSCITLILKGHIKL